MPREETGRGYHEAPDDVYIALRKLQRQQSGKDFLPECDPESLPEPGGSNLNSSVGVRCGAGRSSFSVDWQGGLRPCNTFPCEPESVLDAGFADAWRRINNLANSFPKPCECEGCSYKGSCGGICVVEHASGAPVGHANPAVCIRTKRMIAEGLLKM